MCVCEMWGAVRSEDMCISEHVLRAGEQRGDAWVEEFRKAGVAPPE